ncbi:alpha/beta hydrolase [Fodinicola feengrottensis]|uniref:Alpha/beta hydrolase n=2 Tax=Fodinicola feengrottensis TaxID=435914 RepID=A0ABP4TPD0_9ACTN
MPTLRTTDRTDLFYRDWGTGAPVVFLAGWALSGDMWQYQMLAAAERGFRAVCYDRRGHGRSDDPGRGYDFDTLADDLAALLEHLDLANVTVISHSMGGGEVVRYLSRHGSARVAGVALVGSTMPRLLRSDDNPDGIDPALTDLLRDSMKKDLPQWGVENIGPYVGVDVPGCDVSVASQEWTQRDGLRVSLQAAMDCYRANLEADFRAELVSITVPTLVVQGTHDVSAPPELCGQRIAALVPGSRLAVYPNAPHAIYLTHQDQLTEELLDFAAKKV